MSAPSSRSLPNNFCVSSTWWLQTECETSPVLSKNGQLELSSRCPGQIWKQTTSQTHALKGHPARAQRNQEVAAHLAQYWA
eukprot:2035163-Rhodomonas_salina.2